MTKNLEVIAIAGPTASGKTKLAVEYAKKNNGEIISADSRLVYKGFDIATAKPSLTEREGIIHHLIDIVEPEYDYSVADFYDDAKKAIEMIAAKGKTPVITGGTGLYLKVLLENYSLPRVAADIDLRNQLNRYSTEELSRKLKKIDYNSFCKISPNDRIRLIRAIEVTLISQKPCSEMMGVKDSEYDVTWITPKINSRTELNERINARVDKMIKDGLEDETVQLLKKHGRIKSIVNTIGYQEMIDFIDKNCTFEETVEKIKLNTRHYAKRQLTWFRRNKMLNIDY